MYSSIYLIVYLVSVWILYHGLILEQKPDSYPNCTNNPENNKGPSIMDYVITFCPLNMIFYAIILSTSMLLLITMIVFEIIKFAYEKIFN